jgi:hypothetical protein
MRDICQSEETVLRKTPVFTDYTTPPLYICNPIQGGGQKPWIVLNFYLAMCSKIVAVFTLKVNQKRIPSSYSRIRIQSESVKMHMFRLTYEPMSIRFQLGIALRRWCRL